MRAAGSLYFERMAARLTAEPVTYLTPATASRAGTNRPIFAFQLSDSIPQGVPSLPAAATVKSSQSRVFVKIPPLNGLNWPRVRRSFC